jgi:hypothetical protein
VKWYRSKTAADPGWRAILEREAVEWRAALERARGGPRVLLATSIGGYWAGTTLESLLAVALTLRGADVRVLLCDGVLPACQACEARSFASIERFVRSGPQGTLCDGCFDPGRRLFEGLGLKVHRFSDHLMSPEKERAARIASEVPFDEIARFALDGAAVGEHALAGALRFFARGDLAGETSAEPVLRRYLQAALLTTFAARRLLGSEEWRCATFHHGIYVPQGLLGEAARRQGVRVVNWNPAYRKRCFIFSHGDTYHHTLLDEPVTEWEGISWSDEQESDVLAYLKSRWRGTGDWIWFHKDPIEDLESECRTLGIDLSRPFIGLLTNVIWDAQLHYPRSAFATMTEWLVETVRRFASRPELQLVIRIHPAEVRGTLPSRQRAADELRRAFPQMPPNVRVVPPESRLSTYALMSRANAAIIYGTKTGVELAAMGIPVIVAGEAWVRGKGFTRDTRTAEEYFAMLEKLPFAEAMSAGDVERARKYAYHFFFRRMIPLECTEPTGGDPPYSLRIHRLDELEPGRMAGLDVIVDGILNGSPFVYPAEELKGADAPAGRSCRRP